MTTVNDIRITTEYRPKPVPSAAFDWIATLEGTDGEVYGTGRTELDALDSLLIEMARRELIDSGDDPGPPPEPIEEANGQHDYGLWDPFDKAITFALCGTFGLLIFMQAIRDFWKWVSP